MSRLLNRLMPIFLAVSFLGLALTALVIAQSYKEATVEFYIESRTTDTPLTVGDQLTLKLEVHHPEGARVVLPQLEREWGPFHVLDQSSPKTVSNGDGTETTSKNVSVTVFQPGRYKTPPVVVTHRQPDGTIEDLGAPIVQFQVTSVLTDPDDIDLRDLRTQADLPVPLVWPWIVLTIALITAVVALLAWLVWYYFLRQQKSVAVAPAEVRAPIDDRPPEIIAYEELTRIEGLDLPLQERIKEYYSLISDCLREYIENRYEISALEQTTTEIRRSFRGNDLPQTHSQAFMDVLRESDLVKFAKYQPSPEEIGGLLVQARQVVAQTTPEPPPSQRDEPADVTNPNDLENS